MREDLGRQLPTRGHVLIKAILETAYDDACDPDVRYCLRQSVYCDNRLTDLVFYPTVSKELRAKALEDLCSSLMQHCGCYDS